MRAWQGCLLIATLAMGCTLSRPRTNTPPPVVLAARPTLEQLVEVVNSNSDRVQQLHSDSVRLSNPEQLLGSLNATLDYERPASQHAAANFRLTGNVMGSRQLDLGSNDQEYWMWVKQNQPPTVFWGRHSEFHQSAARDVLPVPPSWIVEALGIVHLDPQGDHEPLYASETQGLLQIRSRLQTPGGELLRILEIDRQRALIVQQQVYDASHNLLAVADASDFTHDPLSGVSLPRSVKIQLPPSGMAFDFEVSSYTVNQPVDPSLWALPRIPDHHYRNLADPADMQGIQLTRNHDFYDSSAYVTQPVRPQIPRAAWRRLPSFSVFR